MVNTGQLSTWVSLPYPAGVKKQKTSFHIELPFLKNSKNFLPNHQFFDSSSMKTVDSVMFLKYPK
jgi:hypothetical protein